jgi:hypothetical protein
MAVEALRRAMSRRLTIIAVLAVSLLFVVEEGHE